MNLHIPLVFFALVLGSVVECQVVTQAPKETQAPVTQAPTETQAPVTQAPKETQAPVTQAPTETQAPVTQSPKETQAPVTQPPKVTEPAVTQSPIPSTAAATQAPKITKKSGTPVDCDKAIGMVGSWAMFGIAVITSLNVMTLAIMIYTLKTISDIPKMSEYLISSSNWLTRTAIRSAIGPSAKQALCEHAKTRPELAKLWGGLEAAEKEEEEERKKTERSLKSDKKGKNQDSKKRDTKGKKKSKK